MKNLIQTLLMCASLALIGGFSTGCMTSKVAQIQPNGSTNFVTIVNESNLEIDSLALQVATTEAASLLVARQPNLVPILRNAQVTIDGIINGLNAQTLDQVLALLKAQNNPQLADEVARLTKLADSVRASLVAKYGSTVGGEITLALLRAVNSGLIVGLGSGQTTAAIPSSVAR